MFLYYVILFRELILLVKRLDKDQVTRSCIFCLIETQELLLQRRSLTVLHLLGDHTHILGTFKTFSAPLPGSIIEQVCQFSWPPQRWSVGLLM